ncbi:thymidylate synthase [Mycobacterium phage Anthony]|uniref:ThyX-like thymidylate synthase n=1 Tax=Mycobacterium phage Anthony TaxID=2599857 RepID=A0A5J6TIJ6_9CAUD|nr:thymidylate synthase [Mycobacterium phage Anthony]QFG10416.1 ThyX-like thymidylate synthase [Mycobacterium phage Anthony]
MKVKLIAATEIDLDALRGIGYEPHPVVPMDDDEPGFGDYDADELAEFAGRNCYLSFDRPNPKTRENEDYLKNILDIGHESVLEHASATFYVETSRSVLTELERHRHLSFSVVSQRYVDAADLGYQMPPAADPFTAPMIHDAWNASTEIYEALVEDLTERRGLPRKKAREAARAVMPNMTNSPMVVTGNHRAWRYVIKQRWHEAADAEIRELAGELLKQLKALAPHTYQDIPDTPYSYGG